MISPQLTHDQPCPLHGSARQKIIGQTTVPPGAFGATAVAAGGDHSLALTTNGEVLAWGANYSGQTDVPSAATHVARISAGGAHSLALCNPTTTTLGSSAALVAPDPGILGTSFQWRFNGQDVSGATNAFLSVASADRTMAGHYQVVISNVLGAFSTPPMLLTVDGAPLRFDTSAGATSFTPDGLKLRLLGASGLGPVIVYATTDLQTWQPIYTSPPVIGAFEVIDAGVTNRPQTFYRARELGSP